jgi:dihydrofolate reductase
VGKLIYAMNVSVDGFVETPDHSLDWGIVDEELHGWFNDQASGVDASIYGRRLYELMSGHWPTAGTDPNTTPVERDFAEIWLNTPKFVVSRTLTNADWNSTLVRGEPREVLAQIRREFHGDVDLGGATLAASFIRAGLVDEYQLLVHPVALGAGTPFFPALDDPLRLELVESKRFNSGVLLLRYGPMSS